MTFKETYLTDPFKRIAITYMDVHNGKTIILSSLSFFNFATQRCASPMGKR